MNLQHSGAKAARRKKTLIALFTLAAVAVNAAVFNGQVQQAQAARSVTVTLDGIRLAFSDVSPQIIKDRTMVPFRAIGEAMGAAVEWDEHNRTVYMTLVDKYVRLRIDSDVMTYGLIAASPSGSVTELTSNTYQLDAAAMILNDRTLVPLRAISEGLGGEVEWDDTTYTVSIKSPFGALLASPSPTPDPIFDDSFWFQNITAAQAQSMYNNNEQFALVFYSTSLSNAKTTIENVKAAAKDAGLRVYGINAALKTFNKDDITFIWRNYVNQSSPGYPFLFLVNGNRDVKYIKSVTNRDNLDVYFPDFVAKLNNWAIPTPATPTPTPRASSTATPSPTPNPNDRFMQISRTVASNMLDSGSKFIYVYYNSDDSSSDYYLSIIKSAAISAQVDVYATNVADGYSTSDKWFGNPTGAPMGYPTVYFIYGTMIEKQSVRPEDEDSLAVELADF